MTQPPLLLCAVSRIKDARMTRENYSAWYSKHHIPDVLSESPCHLTQPLLITTETGSIAHAAGYLGLHSHPGFDATVDWMATYYARDFNLFKPEVYKFIPETGDMLLGGKSIFDVADVQKWMLRHVETVYVNSAAEAGERRKKVLVAVSVDGVVGEELVITYVKQFMGNGKCAKTQRFERAAEDEFGESPSIVVFHEFESEGDVEADIGKGLEGEGRKVEVRTFKLHVALEDDGVRYDFD